MMLEYDYPLYRPPSEAKSLIFQVTLVHGSFDVDSDIIFRANHGSNAFYVNGTFPADKDSMLGADYTSEIDKSGKCLKTARFARILTPVTV